MDVDHARRGTVLDGVLHDVGQPALQDHAIRTHPQTGVTFDLNVLSLLLGEEAEHADHLQGKIQWAEDRSMQRDLAGVRAGYGKEAVDHLGESSHFFQHAADGVSIFFRRMQAL